MGFVLSGLMEACFEGPLKKKRHAEQSVGHDPVSAEEWAQSVWTQLCRTLHAGSVQRINSDDKSAASPREKSCFNSAVDSVPAEFRGSSNFLDVKDKICLALKRLVVKALLLGDWKPGFASWWWWWWLVHQYHATQSVDQSNGVFSRASQTPKTSFV